jgi:hypothetical protein
MSAKKFDTSAVTQNLENMLDDAPAAPEAAAEDNAPVQQQETPARKRQTRSTASPEEAAVRMAEGRTQGRKGCHMQRINIALTPDNYTFLKACSGVMFGANSMTDLINTLVEKYRKEKETEFKEMLALRERMRE